MKKLITFDKHLIWYKGWRRVLIHILFWLIVYFYATVQTSIMITKVDAVFIIYTLREVVIIIILHYFFVYYVFPKLLLKSRWVYSIACILLAYLLIAFGLYYSVYFLKKNFLLPEQMNPFANYYLQYDFFSTLIDPMRIYNTIILNNSLFFTLLIKISKDFFTSSLQNLNLEKKNLKLEKENIELELNFLKSQINPHFFFNTLNNIYSLVFDKDELAADIILKLSGLMRYSLYESSNKKIALKKELKFIHDYVALEKIRHKGHVVISLDISGNPENLEIPPLILITFVENAFKHGVNKSIAASWVNIQANIQDNELSFVIQNSKPLKLSQENIQGGIGIMNVQRRLDLMYPNRYQLSIQNDPLQYKVELKLKLHEKVAELHHSR